MIITATIQLGQDRDPALVRDRLAIYLDRFLAELSVDGVHVIFLDANHVALRDAAGGLYDVIFDQWNIRGALVTSANNPREDNQIIMAAIAMKAALEDYEMAKEAE